MLVGIGFIGMVTGSVATYFVDQLSKRQDIQKKSVADEQVEYVKSKLDDLESMDYDDLKSLWGIVVETWGEKTKTTVKRDDYHEKNVM